MDEAHFDPPHSHLLRRDIMEGRMEGCLFLSNIFALAQVNKMEIKSNSRNHCFGRKQLFYHKFFLPFFNGAMVQLLKVSWPLAEAFFEQLD